MTEIKNKTCRNSVFIEGYLKENNLQRIVTRTGKEAISGAVVIATDENQDYRIRFFVCKTNANGNANHNYDLLEEILPSATISIATLLKNTPDMSFEQAKLQASRIWCRGQFECYDKKDSRGEIQTFVTLRGMGAGFKTSSSRTPFEIRATFDIEGFIENIKNEKDAEGQETDRVIVSMLIPDFYNEVVIPIDFICENAETKNYMNHYQKGDTGRFVGRLRNLRKEIEVKRPSTQFMNGEVQDESYFTYSFVNERIIDNVTYPYEEERGFDAETIKTYRINRETILESLVAEDIVPKTDSSVAEDKNKSGFVL